MKLEEAAAILRRHEQAVAKTNVFRYTNAVSSVDALPDAFGMNFGEMFETPPEKQVEVFCAHEKRGELLRDLMAGKRVDSDEMKTWLGFSAQELADYRAQVNPIKKAFPSNLCVLCFDDAMKSQHDIAMPLLKKLGFRATFFIAELQPGPMGNGFADKTRYMTWDEIADIEAAGFELGNHSLHHVPGAQNMGHDFNIEQIRGMEEEFAAHGLKKPVTYAYPSGVSNPEVVACARECGYLWGRGNQEKGMNGMRGMTYYDPLQDSPLAICNFGDPDFYTPELLEKRIANIPDGMIFGLTYHDVSPENWPSDFTFEKQMECLAAHGMKVISISDLAEYIDPEKAWDYTFDAE